MGTAGYMSRTVRGEADCERTCFLSVLCFTRWRVASAPSRARLPSSSKTPSCTTHRVRCARSTPAFRPGLNRLSTRRSRRTARCVISRQERCAPTFERSLVACLTPRCCVVGVGGERPLRYSWGLLSPRLSVVASRRPSSAPAQIKRSAATISSAENEVGGGVISRMEGICLIPTYGTHFKLLETGEAKSLSVSGA